MAKVPFEAKQQRKLKAAIAWLLLELKDFQPHEVAPLLAKGVEAGHAARTLQRASKSLGVHKKPRYGDDGKITGWTWTQRGLGSVRTRKERKAFTVAP